MIKSEKFISTGIAIELLAGIGSVAYIGSALPKTCLSPRSVSEVYRGDPHAIATDQNTWTTGILAVTQIPTIADGVVISFRNTEHGKWKSTHVLPDALAERVPLRIGPGDVEFSTQLELPAHYGDCYAAPNTAFKGPEQYEQVLDAATVIPSFH